MVRKTQVGSYRGQAVYRYTVENERGTRLSVVNFAAIWDEWSVIDATGKRVNLVLSADSFEDYLLSAMNRITGRVAGRIKDASFTLQDEVITLQPNDGNNLVHGGRNGLYQKMYDVAVDEENGELTLETNITSEEDGFPGDLKVTVVYRLAEDNTVTLTVSGQQSNQLGVFDPTTHGYFNLSPTESTIENQTIRVQANEHLVLDDKKIPTGQLELNTGKYDLTTPKYFKDVLENDGFDTAFKLNKTQEQITLAEPSIGRKLTVSTNRNGLIMYTADALPTEISTNRGPAQRWIGVALEPQTLPDAVHFSHFGDVTMMPNQTKTVVMKYKLEE